VPVGVHGNPGRSPLRSGISGAAKARGRLGRRTPAAPISGKIAPDYQAIHGPRGLATKITASADHIRQEIRSRSQLQG